MFTSLIGVTKEKSIFEGRVYLIKQDAALKLSESQDIGLILPNVA